MATYTIRAVSSDVSTFDWTPPGKTEALKLSNYKLIFEENYDATKSDFEQITVQFVQSASLPPPKKGDKLEGGIDMSAQNGPKFNKDRTAAGGGGGFQRRQFDPTSVYISYAKDLVVAQINSGVKIDLEDAVALAVEQGKRMMALAQKSPEQSELDKKADELFNK